MSKTTLSTRKATKTRSATSTGSPIGSWGEDCLMLQSCVNDLRMILGKAILRRQLTAQLRRYGEHVISHTLSDGSVIQCILKLNLCQRATPDTSTSAKKKSSRSSTPATTK